MSLTYTYTQVHRCLCIHVCTCICVYMCTQTYIYKYVHMYIWPSSHTIIHEGEAFANKTWHILFLPFLNTGQEIPCSGTAKHTCQQHNTQAYMPTAQHPFRISIGYRCLIGLFENKPIFRPTSLACAFANRSKRSVYADCNYSMH